MACYYLECGCGKDFIIIVVILSDVKYTGNEHENCHNHHPDFNKYCLHKNISDTELNDVMFNELFV